MKQRACYLIMAGGTGGHIFPAMAVAKRLMERGADVHWVGTAAGMEYKVVPKEGIPLHLISIKGFRGKTVLAKILSPFLLLAAVWQAIALFRKAQPDVVIGFGGYVSAPGGLAARLLGKKLVIHEQNSVAGSANRLLAKIAYQTLEAFPKSLNNALLVGNPVRAEIQQLFVENKTISDGARKKLLIMGGSLGAEAINNIMPKVIHLLPENIRPELWHQAGKGKLEKLVDHYQELNIEARTEEFVRILFEN